MRRPLTAVAVEAAHVVQRRLRPAAPALTARLTWALKRRRGELSLAALDALVGQGDATVDIGANWGLYTARLTHLTGPEGQVDAFEPHPDHQRTLRSLARRRPQLAVHCMALSDTPGSAVLHVPLVRGRRVTALASLEPPKADVEQETVTVATARLDDVLADRRPPSFVKCDAEGLESAVLRGAEGTLRASHPALLVEIEQRHRADPIDDTFRYLKALGYRGYFFGPDGLNPLEDFDVERDQLAHLQPGVVEYEMPDEYVADFLFVDPAVDVSDLVDRSLR